MPPFDPKTLTSLAQQVSGKSAVNPSLWACTIISLPLFVLSSYASGWVAIASFVVALLPVIAFLFGFIFLLIKNPKYLRSEEFHLRAEAINLFGDKDNPMHAEATHVVSVINNPLLPAPDQQDKPMQLQ